MISTFYFISIYLTLIVLCYAFSLIRDQRIVNDLKMHNKFQNLDGLRGLAALGVFMHHSLFAYNIFIDGKWRIYKGSHGEVVGVVANIFSNIGPVSVCIFFMITGFLFYDKLIRSNGQLDVVSFFKKRFLRIAPLYYFTVLLAFTTSLFFGLTHYSNIFDLTKKIAGWLCFNLLPYSGFTDQFSRGLITAGVIWTLAIEWKFYLIIPLLACFCTSVKLARYFIIIATSLLILFYFSKIYSPRETSILLCFLLGMGTAAFYELLIKINLFRNWVLGVLCFLLVIYSLAYHHGVYRPELVIFFFPFFVVAVYGNNILGLLKSRALRFAGTISYSVYLMHGLVLIIVNAILHQVLGYKYITFISAFIVIFISTLTYLYIERPFIRGGVINKLQKENSVND